MLLRPDSLRGGGPPVPRNELPLLDLPADHRRAVCRLVQRQAVRVSIRAGSSLALPLEQQATRSFCPHCGTQLTFQADDYPDEIDITTCSLDHPEAVPPRDHTYTSSKVQWIELADGLPRYAQARS
jgi:hypothetical protein